MLLSLGEQLSVSHLITEKAEAPRGRQPELPSWLVMALGGETPEARVPRARAWTTGPGVLTSPRGSLLVWWSLWTPSQDNLVPVYKIYRLSKVTN